MTELKSSTSGMITFGMVSVPVRFYPAVSEKNVSLATVHQGCTSGVKAPRFCPDCDRLLTTADVVTKGYKVGKQLVILTPEELDNLPSINTKAIEIVGFTDADAVDRAAYEKSYYLGPDDRTKVGDKAFRLLHAGLKESGKVAVARLARSGKEQIASIRALGGVLVMDYLYWPDECNSTDDVPVPAGEVSEDEVKMAMMLIDAMPDGQEVLETATDGYRAAVEQLVEAKLTGAPIQLRPATTEEAPAAVDLMAQMRASVEAMKAAKAEPAAVAAPKGKKGKAA